MRIGDGDWGWLGAWAMQSFVDLRFAFEPRSVS